MTRKYRQGKSKAVRMREFREWQMKRKIPYTERGIKRKKCIRCENQAIHQWQICADGNNYRPICIQCDIELNKLVLDFMKHPKKEELSKDYEELKLNDR